MLKMASQNGYMAGRLGTGKLRTRNLSKTSIFGDA
jgi:hypothetical protein